ncbi:hypothetical protein LSH36_1591g00005 [Paralvinella palmiformis]|uniref:Uncharacterized protein n=1 Tax=Paralvinella palmiformis TaxID=53620 RepID=A0AAD9ITL5_9ANNE|nr:hypothetical protein LSH36_1591g00005 [Paralvinella palmiformis]
MLEKIKAPVVHISKYSGSTEGSGPQAYLDQSKRQFDITTTHTKKVRNLSLHFLAEFQPSIRDNGTSDGMERWGYVDIREGAHLFWWLYYTYHSDSYLNRPWIIWLQGGPGWSSCGSGNFELIGPLNVTLDLRTETWVTQ